jgi:Na+/H+ antiporter NhaD/arsenite permease-like protein
MTTPQIAAGGLFIITLAVILSERLHRTTAAGIGAALMIIIGTELEFYSQEEALRSIDFNTLGLLLGMMIMVRLLEETGFFQYIAILTGKWSGGQPWILLVILGATTSLLSMVLDNVTTVILIAPVTILIADILGLSPVPFLMAEAMLSNTGGVATLVGDPPNVIIGSAAEFSFNDFLTHLAPIVLFAWVAALAALRYLFRRELAAQPKNIQALLKLDEHEALKNRANARKLLIILGLVIVLFFFHGPLHFLPATIAMGGAALALFWVRTNVEETLSHLEWGVLLFFAGLFVMVGGLEASGLLGLLATGIMGLAQNNLWLASLVILWVATIVSAAVDNIPFTIAMAPIIQRLAAVGVPVSPLWWALALGAGFGGNGTPLGATANVVVISMSERTSTPISMRHWLKVGTPVMLVTSIVATILFIILFEWMKTPL